MCGSTTPGATARRGGDAYGRAGAERGEGGRGGLKNPAGVRPCAGYLYANLVDTDPALLEEAPGHAPTTPPPQSVLPSPLSGAARTATELLPARAHTTETAGGQVVLTNTLGTLLCCRAAMALMAAQPPGAGGQKGRVYNMEGAGSDGAATRLFAAYGATKAGVAQLTRSLAAEAAGSGVAVASISPGIVMTELVAAGRDAFGSQGRFFVNALCEPAEAAAAAIVSQVRATGGGGGDIRLLTPPVAAGKLVRRLVLGEGKGRYYPEGDDESGYNL